MRCTLCGRDVPEFLWPLLGEPGSPGGHFVLAESPITIRHEPPTDFGWVKVVAEAKIRTMLCRDRPPPTDAELPSIIDAAHRAVMDDADVIMADGRTVEQIRADNRAALIDEERRAGEILRAGRVARPVTVPRVTLFGKPRGRHRAGD